MKLVEIHYIKKSHKYFDECNRLSFKSKNIYNVANYIIRQEFIKNGKYLSAYNIQPMLQGKDKDYIRLPAKVSQQVLRQLHNNWKSFFRGIKDWKENPQKYEGRPNLPKYKRKQGRNIVIYDRQAISKRALKKGIVKLSQTNIEIKYQHKGQKICQARVIPINKNLYKIEIIYEQNPKKFDLKNKRVIGIDIGVNNICAISSNFDKPILIKGGKIKSINQYYNKKRSKLQSILKKRNDKFVSNQIIKLTNKRNRKINYELHCITKQIISYSLANKVSRIIIGYNKQIKQRVNIGKRNNQNFVNIPYYKLLEMLGYKAELVGIEVKITEENYTSKCDALAEEPLHKQKKYLGQRIKRGLFKSSIGKIINADINGSLNIIRKVLPKVFTNGIEGFAVNPISVYYPYKLVS